MNISLILIVALMVFVPFRIMFVVLYGFLCKIFKVTNDLTGFWKVGFSIFFLITYMQTFLGAIEGVSRNNNFSNLEWYIIYSFIGIVLMFWCYFSWDLKLKSIPRFGGDNCFIAIKKILVFICVLIFSCYYGYKTLNQAIEGEEIDIIVIITNVTIISGIIAFDRVLNQIMVLKKSK